MENELLEETGYVGDIPEGWRWVKLGDEIELLYGKGLTEKERKNGIYPVYGSSGIIGYHNNYLVKGPGVIIGRKGSVGEVNLSKTDFYPIDTTYYLKLKNDNDIFFFYYLLKTLRLNEINSHSAVPGLSREDIYSLYIPLPPLPEQKAIAEVLSSIDDKIELLHRQNKTLEETAMTLFRQWFIEPTKDGLPDGWEEVELYKLGQIICGKTPSKNKPEYFGGKIPFIKIPDMHGNVFVFKTEDSLSEIGAKTQKNKTLPERSICVSCIATVGLVSMNAFISQTNQQINSIIPYKEFYRYFLYLKMKSMKEELIAMASGGTATLNLNTTEFSKIKIEIPKEDYLHVFHEKTKYIFEKIFINTSQIQTLEKLRDTLLPKLMSGEIRVKI